MTNAEAVMQALNFAINHESDYFIMVALYISCPYINNLDCEYDGANNICCDDCKAEWLQKVFEY